MGKMNGSGMSTTSRSHVETPSDLFKELWERLRECHDMEMQGLQDKVNKLKKERCLDAQRLEEFHSKNQLLREQLKSLQDNVKVLEDRLRGGLCDRCSVTEELMRTKREEFESTKQQNLRLISELMKERNSLQDENRKLCQEVEELKSLRLSQDPSPVPEEGVIPDSPLQQLPLPAVNRMRRKRNSKHTRYAEKPASASGQNLTGDELLMGSSSADSIDHVTDVLVADTCEMDVFHTKTEARLGNASVNSLDRVNDVIVAETCAMDVSQVTDECADQPPTVELDSSLPKFVADDPTYPKLSVRKPFEETADMDCTFVSPSMLQKGLRESWPDDSRTGIGQKANDSLAEMFDKSAFGEYESCLEDEVSDLEQEEPHSVEECHPLDQEAQSPPKRAVLKCQTNLNEQRNISFPYVEVECETYYAGLPEAELQKKLSACSRHRFRYIPPSTPENFWEVGFPSTQVCIQRGYIKEDNEPDPRMRRRRPYNAMFSPKAKQHKI
ncbi:hypothetical protein GJAV_G00069700 [Gymnothorax javanicus]|nr:hypothetical protein GJAV_G00069700 [Gymnothorax javanicus]